MNRRFVVRPLLSLLIGFLVAFPRLEPASQSVPRNEVSGHGSSLTSNATLRVGVWTLWRDRNLILSPAVGRTITMKVCPDCAVVSFAKPVHAEAAGNALVLTSADNRSNAKRIWLAGTITLKAHDESVTLPYPIAISASSGVLVIAVTLPVETYVERVVTSESGPADTAESLKALSIVVRTFALHETHRHSDYDLCDSTHCQLLHWSGNNDRRAAAHAAALATSGETLWFRGQRAHAYFGKDCGGHTASPDEIWPRAETTPYLPSLTDRYCSADGAQEWASEISRGDLTSLLAAHGLVAPGWQNLDVSRRGTSARAVTLRFDQHEVAAEEFRIAVGESLGWNRIPSTWFEVSRQGDEFVFHGRGWGHGVGLCQKGAATMAAQGHFSREILAQYFPGANVADEATGREWKRIVGDGFILESLDSADAAYLPELNRARAEASARSGLNSTSPFTVRAFASTPAFRDATLAPGWIAAFTEGDWIGAQPLRTLTARHLLIGTLSHEFLHALVERQAAPGTPLWLREGLVEVWSDPGEDAHAHLMNNQRPALSIAAVDAGLAHASTEAESRAAHRAASWYAAQLLTRFGRAQILQWLHSDLPAGITATLR